MRSTDTIVSADCMLSKRVLAHLELGILIRLVRTVLGETLDVFDGLVELFLHGQCHDWGSEMVVVGGQLQG